MAMASEVFVDKTSIAPKTSRRKYDKIEEEKRQSPRQQRQYLQLPQQSFSSYDYCHYYQNDSDYRQNASTSKQQPSSSPSSTTSPSQKLILSRGSFRDLYVPKFWYNLRKSASEISLVLGAMRSAPLLQMDETSSSLATVVGGSVTESIRCSAVLKERKCRNAFVTWQNYSLHHLNKQLRHGN
ncbi:unnamed protein product [Litomosoides sigmodontis]|uniref:Uncharacterized protein n=1 Tax=Litomosoides sigmodontis TaxID=42156 RepID=A0A3P6TUV6_LITSI|nr:unnamed protein product [Litomosoides sigmodontis]